MSGVRRLFRWAPPYLAGAAIVSTVAGVAVALLGARESATTACLAIAFGLVAILSTLQLFAACSEWRRAARIERAIHQPARGRGAVVQQGWFGQVAHSDGWIR